MARTIENFTFGPFVDVHNLIQPEPAFTLYAGRPRPSDRDSVAMLKLWSAILEDAVDCFRKYRRSKRKHERVEYEAARRWIFTDGWQNAVALGFPDICERLGFDYRAVRTALALTVEVDDRSSIKRRKVKLVPIDWSLYAEVQLCTQVQSAR